MVRGDTSGGSPSQSSYSNSGTGYMNDPSMGQMPQRPGSQMAQGQMGAMTPLVMVLMMLSGLRRSWKWAIPVGLILGLTAASLIYFLFPIKYKATARIRIYSQKPHIVFQDEGERGAYESFVSTQLSLLKNPMILNNVLAVPEVSKLPSIMKEKDPLDWLQKNINVSADMKSSEYYTISLLSENPDEAKILVNLLVNNYMAYYRDESSQLNRVLLENLNRENNRKTQAVKQLQNEIRAKVEQISGSEGGRIADPNSTMMSGGGEATIYKEIVMAEAELEMLETEMNMASDVLSKPIEIDNYILDVYVKQRTGNNEVLSRIATLKEQIKQLEKSLAPGAARTDRRILELLGEVKQLESQSGGAPDMQLRDQIRQELEEQAKLEAMAQFKLKEEQIKGQKRYIATMREKNAKMVDDNRKTGREMAEVIFVQQELDRANAVLSLLQQRITSLQTESAAPLRVNMQHEAQTPREPENKMKIPITVMGGIGLFAFPLFLGIVFEFMKPRLYHTSQIRAALPDTIIGEIMEPPVAWIHGTTFRKRLARYRESVHNWCTYLLLSNPYRHCRTMAIASVASDDGKTFLAVQIAAAMAQMKSGPVLLIDGDMRVGRLHLLFGNEESGIGLADVLAFRKGIGEAVVMNEKEPNLHLLSAGNLDTSPYELLGDGRFRELLDTLEKHYSLILVVLPPISNASESLLMASSVDSTILCVRQGATVVGAMQEVHRRLIVTGSHIDGIVVKDIPYYQMSGKDGGFSDRIEQIRLAHLLQYSE